MKKKKYETTIRSATAEYLTYVASVGDRLDSIEMRYENENIWLTQKMMAALYDVDVRTISEHIKKIYADSELEEDSTIRKFRIVQTEGSRQVNRVMLHRGSARRAPKIILYHLLNFPTDKTSFFAQFFWGGYHTPEAQRFFNRHPEGRKRSAI